MPSRPAADSQQSLARSIARAVRGSLPAPDSEDAITASAESALREEARSSERLIAYLRVGLLTAFNVLSVVADIWPRLERAPLYLMPQAGLMLFWLMVAGGLLVSLARGWYPSWLRRAIPVLDAVIIASMFTALVLGFAPEPVPAGFVAMVATACVFLAFSGALRLSRTAARRAGVLAVLVWTYAVLLAGLGALEALVVGVTVAAAGVLGARVTRGIRRVVTVEVTRVRLEELYRSAQKAIDAREEALHIVSHDLRNPLSRIAMTTKLLLEVPASEEQQAKWLGIIRRAEEQARWLVQDLLDAAQLEAGRLRIEPVTVPAETLLADALEMMRPHAEPEKLDLVIAQHGRLPNVHADPKRILQVFSNLVGNAIKFTPAGGRIILLAESAGEKVRFAVRDTGPGIPPDQLDQIFNRLWQADQNDGRGIGLGLTIARSIMEAHGERIGVESRVGEGTEFWFTAGVAGHDA
jgi:signal transduction histidine kinase